MSLVSNGDAGVGAALIWPQRSPHGGDTASPFWSQPFLALGLAGIWLALLAGFNAAPGMDRFMSEFFFTPAACPAAGGGAICGDFSARLDPFLPGLRRVFHYLPAIVAIALVAVLIGERRKGGGLSRARYAGCALGAFALGPGLLVNALLKEHWGRPRPVATDLFGGQLPFVPAGEWSDACVSNCSFVSGEASTIAWLVCLVPLLPQRLRRAGIVLAAAVAIFAALLRVAFGGHYLSDVVLGALSTIVIFAGLLRFVEWRAGQRRISAAACGDAAS